MRSTLIILIITSVFIIGCETYLAQEYTYKDQEILNEWGKVWVGLRGSWRSIGKDQILGSPYELYITIHPYKNINGFAVINNIEMMDIDKEQIVFEHSDSGLKKNFITKEKDGIYSAIFKITGLNLEYNRYKLAVEVEIESDEVNFSGKKMEFTFEKDYKERRENLFWSILSGA